MAEGISYRPIYIPLTIRQPYFSFVLVGEVGIAHDVEMNSVTPGQFDIIDKGSEYHFRYGVVASVTFIDPFKGTPDCPYWNWLKQNVSPNHHDEFWVTGEKIILFKNFADAVAFKLRWNGVRLEKPQ